LRLPPHTRIPPWLVLRDPWRFPRLPRAEAFFDTRGGMRLPSLVTAGVCGVAPRGLVFVFALRGLSIARAERFSLTCHLSVT